MINGSLVPVSQNGSFIGSIASQPLRKQFVEDLKNRKVAEKSRNMNIDQLKSSFKTTDLMTKEKRVVVDPLAQELEAAADDSDSDYNPLDKPVE